MLSAYELARAVAQGADLPSAILARCARAIEAGEAEIGAFAHLDIEAAHRRSAEAHLAGRPLAGLPVALKDIIDTADMPTAHGSPIYAGWRPRADAAIAAMVRRAGGVVLGKTVTTPFAYLDPAGTRNPRRPTHTPGGSSSGSAAAVAAGFAPIAIGTQTGGSVIRPASYCGVAAFKPSYKLVPTVGVKTFSWSLDTVGFFAAGVLDVAFAAAAVTGRDLLVADVATPTPRLALVRTAQWDEATADAQAALLRAAAACADAGAAVVERELPPAVDGAFKVHATIQDYEAVRALAFEYDNHRGDLPPQLRRLLDAAQAIAPDDYDAARRTARVARHALADMWGDVDALLTLAAPGEAPAGLGSTGTSIMNRLWTLMGNPCVCVPGLVGASGLPIGVQVVGRFGRDRAALAAARFVERALKAAG